MSCLIHSSRVLPERGNLCPQVYPGPKPQAGRGAAAHRVEQHNRFLAYGYLIASAAGIVIYSWMLVRLLQEQQLLQQLRSSPLKFPAREILAFVLPGLSSSLVTVAIHSVNIFILVTCTR